MLNVPAAEARNHTVILLRPGSRSTTIGACCDLLGGSVFSTVECISLESTLHAMLRGCRIGLLLLEEETDLDHLGLYTPALRTAGTVWIGLIALSLVHLPAVRECIAERLFNFLTWPSPAEELVRCLRHAWGVAYVRALHERALDTPAGGQTGDIVGKSAQMQQLFCQIRKVARTDAAVLIAGASGTGKELAALSIHRQSGRARGPFVAVNCGAIAPQLFQSELFGHEKGAFTGATQRKIGRIEAAQGGTLFLDEIGDMPFEMQVNLLRFLQEKTIERVGAHEPVAVDVRIITATHVDLADAVVQKRFREDLYYRINVVCVTIPRLADRPQDIEDIACHYFAKFARSHNRSLRGFSRLAMDAMMAHSWPGNVRELVNRVQRAAVMAEGRFIHPEDLGFERQCERNGMMTLAEARGAAEQVMIRRALSQARNQVSRAATLLGISRVTLYRLIDKYNIYDHTAATLSGPPHAANDMPLQREAALLTQS